jgi:hypothetical protein
VPALVFHERDQDVSILMRYVDTTVCDSQVRAFVLQSAKSPSMKQNHMDESAVRPLSRNAFGRAGVVGALRFLRNLSLVSEAQPTV